VQVIVNGQVFDAGAGLAGVVASDGAIIYPDSLAHTYTYDSQNRLTVDTVASGPSTYKQTYTYVGNTKNVASVSQWVKQ